MKKFTKAFLKNRLKFDEDEAKLVMQYQKQFPELLQDVDGFVIDGRNLWTQLGEPQGLFANWIKRKVVDKGFINEVDYTSFNKIEKRDNGGNKSTEYTLTVDCAKNVCMMENSPSGFIVRKYFILMEKAIRKNIDWEKIRFPQKQSYKEMCIVLKRKYMEQYNGRLPDNYLYSNNADMINMALFGHKSMAMKKILEIDYSEPLRDNLTIEANKVLSELQSLNTNLVLANMDFKQRKEIIVNTSNFRFANIKDEINKMFSKELKVA